MWMLTVVEGLTLEFLARLKQQRIAVTTKCEWLKAHHPAQRQLASRNGATRHQHSPVNAGELLGAARSILTIIHSERDAMQHQGPRSRHHVLRMHRRGIGKPARP